MTTGLKQCSKCRELKALSEYRKNARGKNGLRADCKSCHLNPKKRETLIDGQKRCITCKEIKDLNAFQIRRDYGTLRGQCKECKRESYTAYYAANKNRFDQHKRDWVKNNPERQAASSSKWAKKNRAQLNRKDATRRASELHATPIWLTAIHKAQIQEMYDIAVARTMQTGTFYEVDHIHPLRGNGFSGLHVPWNLQVISQYENRSKGNSLPIGETHLFWRSC